MPSSIPTQKVSVGTPGTVIRRRVVLKRLPRQTPQDEFTNQDMFKIGAANPRYAQQMAIPNRIASLKTVLQEEILQNMGGGALQLELDKKRSQIKNIQQAKTEYLSHKKYVRALYRDSIVGKYGLGSWERVADSSHTQTLDDQIAKLTIGVGQVESDLVQRRGAIRKAGLQLIALNTLDSNRVESELRPLTLQEEPKFEIRKRLFILDGKARLLQQKSADMAAEGIGWAQTASCQIFRDAITQIELVHQKLEGYLAAYRQHENQLGELNPYALGFPDKYEAAQQLLVEGSRAGVDLLGAHENEFFRVLQEKKQAYDLAQKRKAGAKQIAHEALKGISLLDGYQELKNEPVIVAHLDSFQKQFDEIISQESLVSNEQLISLTFGGLSPKIREAIQSIQRRNDADVSSQLASGVTTASQAHTTLHKLERALENFPKLEELRERVSNGRTFFLEQLGRKIAEKIKDAVMFGPEQLLIILGVEKLGSGGNWEDYDLADLGSALSDQIMGNYMRGCYLLTDSQKIVLKAFLQERKNRFPVDIRHAKAGCIRAECDAGLEQLIDQS